MKRRLRGAYQVVKATYQGWSADKASGLAAGLAYYTVFSLAPLVIIAVAVAGALFDQNVAREAVLSEVRSITGESGVITIRAMMAAASKPGDSVVATIIGSATLLLGATSVFSHLQDALNTIWNVEAKPVKARASIVRFAVRRVLSFGMVLVLGFLLVVSLVASAVIAGAGDFIFGGLPTWLAQVANQGVTLGFTTVLFALMFKVLPDVRIAWRDVWIGALLTAVMFGLGRYLIGVYLGRSSLSSAYGAAGALVLMLVWIYYSANILFLGAEMTQVISQRRAARKTRPARTLASVASAAAPLTVLVLMLGSGCGASKKDARFEYQDAEERIVRKLEILGNHAFSDATLGKKLQSSTRYTPLGLRIDQQRIVAFYREHGYFDTRVERAEVHQYDDTQVGIRFVIVEGPPTMVTGIEVKGAPTSPGPDPAEVRKLADLPTGEPFRHPDYMLAKQRVAQQLRNDGFAHAKVEGKVWVDRNQARAAVELDLDPGPLTRFGSLRVVGTKRVPESAVRGRVSWKHGDVFDPDKLERTRSRLYGLGYFSSVRIAYQQEGRPEISDVTIQVREATRHEVRIGGGVAADQSRFDVHGRASYRVKGWLRPLLTLTLDARPGYTVTLQGPVQQNGISGEAVVGLTKHDLFLPRMRGIAEAAYRADTYEAFVQRGPRGRLTVDQPLLDDRLILSGGWSMAYLDVLPVDDAVGAALGNDSPYRLGRFEQGILWDGRDTPFDPGRGVYLGLTLAEGGAFAGGSVGYLQAEPDVRGYLSLGSRLVLASRVKLGLLRGDDANGGVAPLPVRFFGGGPTGHRGFRYRHLSPEVTSSAGDRLAVGASALLESSVEARVDVTKIWKYWLQVAGFVDAGDATASWQAMDAGNLHYAVGGGLRYQTPVGALRIDVGVRVNRLEGADVPDPGRRVALHFGLGESF